MKSLGCFCEYLEAVRDSLQPRDGWVQPPAFMDKVTGGSDGKESARNAGDWGSIPGSGRPPGGGSGNPFLYSCLEKSMDREAWWAIVHGVTKRLDMT